LQIHNLYLDCTREVYVHLKIKGIPFLDFPVTNETLILVSRGIKRLCIDNDVKQKDLAELLGYNSAYLSQLLTGSRVFSFKHLIVIADLFSKSLSELFIYCRSPHRSDIHLEGLIEAALILEACPAFQS